MAVSAMQTMLLLDLIRRSRLNAPLGAVFRTVTAADAGICDLIALFGDLPFADGIALSENRIDTEMEILDLSVSNFKYDSR